ncbi:MAG: hypothetical protein AAGC46_05355 [Solirubrobacteraceae bacterium]|nr:hypothetical protein [Patulibacter sp.]
MLRLRSLLPVLLIALAPVSAAHAEIPGATDAATRAAAAKLASGGLGTCAIDPAQTVQCWGDDHFGQLLNGDDTAVGANPGEGPLPIFLDRGVQVSSVAYSAQHVCALSTTGGVWCWGNDIYGQLGDAARGNGVGDDPGERAVKVAIPPATQVAVGDDFSCAVLTDGSVDCWGRNANGQLGRGTVDDNGYGPGPVALGGKKATAISARAGHVCALVEGSELRCWGSNSLGESGVVPPAYPASTSISTPVKPTILAAGDVPIAVALGTQFGCAILTTGAVRCWGSAQAGQMLTGKQNAIGATAKTPAETAAQPNIGGTGKAKAIATGTDTVCVIRTDDKLACWGKNDSGMLGIGLLPGGGNWGDGKDASDQPETTAKLIDLGPGRTAAAVSIGIFHTCVLLTTGAPVCWGGSGSGQWGTGEKGSYVTAAARTAVTFSGPLPDTDGDGLPDRFDTCPAQPAQTADGCPVAAVVTPTPTPTPQPPVVKTPPTKTPAPATLDGKKVSFDVSLTPSKSGTCPAKATLEIKAGSKSAAKTSVKLKKTGTGKKTTCRAKGSITLKAKPKSGSKVTAKFSGSGVKSKTVTVDTDA